MVDIGGGVIPITYIMSSIVRRISPVLDTILCTITSKDLLFPCWGSTALSICEASRGSLGLCGQGLEHVGVE